MPDLLVPVDEPCRVAHVEWDRGHEDFDAIVRLECEESIVVTVVHDLWPQAGCQWIRRDEVVNEETVEPGSAVVRVLDGLGVRMFGVDPALGDLHQLFTQAAGAASLIGIYTARTGSDDLSVGTPRSVTATTVVLEEVSSDGERTDTTLEYEIAEVISVEWGTDYLHALELLLAED